MANNIIMKKENNIIMKKENNIFMKIIMKKMKVKGLLPHTKLGTKKFLTEKIKFKIPFLAFSF